MLTSVDKQEVQLVVKILSVLYQWGGISNNTPGDTEILTDGISTVTAEELEAAIVIVDKLSQQAHVQRSLSDGQIKEKENGSH